MANLEKNEYDLFLSFELSTQHKAILMKTKLKNYYTIETKQDKDVEQLITSIKSCKIFICFLTKKYLETNQCKVELLFASEIRKCVILLLMDEFDNNEIDSFDAQMINCFGDKQQHNLYDECLNDLKSRINANLKVNFENYLALKITLN